jgi:hypothetical protein
MAPAVYISDPFIYPGGGVAAGVLVKVLFQGTEISAPIYHDSFGVRAPNPIRTDQDGVITFFAEPGEYTLRANGSDTNVSVLPGVVSDDAAYSYDLSVGGAGGPGVGTGQLYNNTGRSQTVVSVRVTALDVGGGGLAVDVNIDGVTIFASPADRPTLPVASGTGTVIEFLAEPVELPDGSYLTVDVDSGTYNHLVVQIFVR